MTAIACSGRPRLQAPAQTLPRRRRWRGALPVGAACVLDETADGGATSVTYPDPNHPADEISFFAVEGNAHGDEDWRPQMDLDTLGVAERYDTN